VGDNNQLAYLFISKANAVLKKARRAFSLADMPFLGIFLGSPSLPRTPRQKNATTKNKQNRVGLHGVRVV
jgi:hypothetical protein